MSEAADSDAGEPSAVMAKMNALYGRLQDLRAALIEERFGDANDITKAITEDAERYNCPLCEHLGLGLRGGVAFAHAMPNEATRADRVEAVLSEVDEQIAQVEAEIGMLQDEEDDGDI